MSIRSTAKALIVHDGKVLLNRCFDSNNGDYYSMPGGGQNKYETLFDAAVRECKEETGYDVRPLKLLGVCEAICLDEAFRAAYPEYAHKMYHIFLCELVGDRAEIPTEKDDMQISSEWIELGELKSIRLLPKAVGEQISDILSGTAPLFLGSEFVRFNHG